MKKSYFRFSYYWFLVLLIPNCLLGLCLYRLIDVQFYMGTLTNILIFIIFILILIWTILLCSFHITFDKKSLRVTGDNLSKIEKIQYKCSVN